MGDFTSFLPRFKEINADYFVSKCTRFNDDLSIVDIPKIREMLRDDEIVLYASILYATNLLSQIANSYVTSLFALKNDEEKRSLFPEVFGILSTAYKHVCPSIPATIIIYCHKDPSGPWNRELEIATWRQYVENFDAAIHWIQGSLSVLLPYLSDKKIEDAEMQEINAYIRNEHLRISDEIYKYSDESHRISNY